MADLPSDDPRWGPRLLGDGTYVDRPRPSWRYSVVVLAIGLCALAAIALAFRDPRWVVAALSLCALFAVLAPLAWVKSHVAYRMDEDALSVRVGFQRPRLPYSRIHDVRRLPGAMPTLGNRPLGVVEVNATTRFPVRITPSDPDAFMRELTGRIAAREGRRNTWPVGPLILSLTRARAGLAEPPLSERRTDRRWARKREPVPRSGLISGEPRQPTSSSSA